jgi:hypothetical protein
MKAHSDDKAMGRSYSANIQPTFWVHERERETTRLHGDIVEGITFTVIDMTN